MRTRTAGRRERAPAQTGVLVPDRAQEQEQAPVQERAQAQAQALVLVLVPVQVQVQVPVQVQVQVREQALVPVPVPVPVPEWAKPRERGLGCWRSADWSGCRRCHHHRPSAGRAPAPSP
ncbi:hypothetical protein FHT39_003317 [Mitsuaria sp. BK045]|uniref:hypothetical protein n=1 Tax=Mitsuaria sp. BK045 TaxID=2587124 RepID=UPI0017E0E677|nr:hypothetical protein [Mitsuaria sp. BK045]MBB3363853.1 hypothetical protein [Mitsuaria sp. BK045]